MARGRGDRRGRRAGRPGADLHARQGPRPVRGRRPRSCSSTGARSSCSTPPAVQEKFGVPPESIPDYLGLVGDTADGFPGLPGLGGQVGRRRARPLRPPRGHPPRRRRLGRQRPRRRQAGGHPARPVRPGAAVPPHRHHRARRPHDRRRRRAASGRARAPSSSRCASASTRPAWSSGPCAWPRPEPEAGPARWSIDPSGRARRRPLITGSVVRRRSGGGLGLGGGLGVARRSMTGSDGASSRLGLGRAWPRRLPRRSCRLAVASRPSRTRPWPSRGSGPAWAAWTPPKSRTTTSKTMRHLGDPRCPWETPSTRCGPVFQRTEGARRPGRAGTA